MAGNGVVHVHGMGAVPVSRVGASLHARVGLESMAAPSRERFVATGAALANDVDALARLRFGLRERMRTSALGDPSLWVLHMESAYRAQWARWCQTGRPLS